MTSTTLPAGTRIAGYELTGMIGSGGYGDVYEAHAGDQQVAIKVLQALARDERARFTREIRCVGLLEHPNMPRLLDIGELADARPYYVMELLRGEPLVASVARRGSLPLDEVLATVRALAAVLDTAHARGIVHRDVKPSNVFLADRPVLLDFGIAKLLDDTNPPLTRSDAIVGSPMTMSPEQLRGDAIDERTDVYGLGIVTYFAVCGRLPFSHDDAAILEQLVLFGEPPPVGRHASTPAAVEAVVSRALAKDPRKRPPSANAFADELEHAVLGKEAVAAFVEVCPARTEAELDDDDLLRLDRILSKVTRELVAHGLVVDAIAQDSVLLIGHGAADNRLDRLASALIANEHHDGTLSITIARGVFEQLRIVSSWLPAARRSGVSLESTRSLQV